jgi:phage terminase large subunit
MFAEMMIEEHIINPNQSSVCVREIQKSLNQSVKRLLELKIEELNVGEFFEIQDAVIKSTAWKWANNLSGYAEPHRRLHKIA